MSPWAVLGVPPGASEAELRAAYRKQAAATHPDRSPDGAEAFIRVQAAYRVLTDPALAERRMLDPEGTFEVELMIERRRAQRARRRARVAKLYE